MNHQTWSGQGMARPFRPQQLQVPMVGYSTQVPFGVLPHSPLRGETNILPSPVSDEGFGMFPVFDHIQRPPSSRPNSMPSTNSPFPTPGMNRMTSAHPTQLVQPQSASRLQLYEQFAAQHSNNIDNQYLHRKIREFADRNNSWGTNLEVMIRQLLAASTPVTVSNVPPISPPAVVDFYYLAIHQLFCILLLRTWSGEDRYVPVLWHIQEQKYVVNLLHRLFLRNSPLSNEYVRFFAELPIPSDLIQFDTSPTYANAAFIMNILGKRFPLVESQVSARKSSPSPEEIFSNFMIPTETLQLDIWRYLEFTYASGQAGAEVCARLENSFRTRHREFYTRLIANHPQFDLAKRHNIAMAAVTNVPCQASSQVPTMQRVHSNVNLQQIHNTTSQTARHTPLRKNFFPPRGTSAPQPAQPMPSRYALHLAPLRSPILSLSPLSNSDNSRRYCYLSSWTSTPASFTNKSVLCEITFEMSENILAKIPKDTPKNTGIDHTIRHLSDDSLSFRLRCIKGSPPEDESKWASIDTHWPENVYFTLNESLLHKRHKSAFGRDLAIDLNSALKLGENKLRVSCNMNRQKPRIETYSFAVEEVAITHHEDVIRKAKERIIPEEQVKRAGSSDEDIAFVNVKISLLDPITAAKICKNPVKGPNCRHRECFDLETFLETRPDALKLSNSEKTDHPPQEPQPAVRVSQVDCWKCPICAEDARPCSLATDAWTSGVRDKLEEMGKLHSTRAIVVDAEGGWTIHEETKDRDQAGRSASQALGDEGTITPNPGTKRKATAEVIELD